MASHGDTSLIEYLRVQAAEPPLLVGQMETATTWDEPAEMLRPPLDVAFIGTADLSVSMGTPGDLKEPRVRRRMEEIASAAASGGIALGGFASDVADVRRLRALGARYLLVGSDVSMLREGLAGNATIVREALNGTG
jgi:4-hydroxy-2-oxoheptanedioate aldolase